MFMNTKKYRSVLFKCGMNKVSHVEDETDYFCLPTGDTWTMFEYNIDRNVYAVYEGSAEDHTPGCWIRANALLIYALMNHYRCIPITKLVESDRFEYEDVIETQYHGLDETVFMTTTPCDEMNRAICLDPDNGEELMCGVSAHKTLDNSDVVMVYQTSTSFSTLITGYKPSYYQLAKYGMIGYDFDLDKQIENSIFLINKLSLNQVL